MIHLGLIGYPLGHSLSPKVHTAALKACGLDGDYSLFPIPPDNKQALEELLERVRSGTIQGLNVTIPHKQNVIEFIDELTPTAKLIGAVNTIYLKDERLIGDNTDASGFLRDLKNAFDFSNLNFQPSVLILGAGGSARAVVYALLHDGWKVTISARRIEQATKLANSFPDYPGSIIHSSNLPTFNFHSFQLIVNTTPIGMSPNINESPLPENLSLPSNVFIYDLVYNPRETKLVKDVKQNGNQAATGLGMLIEQAALAFELWTGKQPTREILWKAVDH